MDRRKIYAISESQPAILDTVYEKFHECIQDKNPIEARISVFERIRDIPYATESVHPTRMFEINRGSCSTKHSTLAIVYGKLRIPTEYVAYPFRWSEVDADWPSELKKLAEEMPIDYHLACKARIDDKLVLVDATWDKPLEKLGFYVNRWDGVSATRNAVNPLDEITLPERMEYFEEEMASLTKKEKLAISKFHRKFNEWLRSVRV